jgi:hypothetical protein
VCCVREKEREREREKNRKRENVLCVRHGERESNIGSQKRILTIPAEGRTHTHTNKIKIKVLMCR